MNILRRITFAIRAAWLMLFMDAATLQRIYHNLKYWGRKL